MIQTRRHTLATMVVTLLSAFALAGCQNEPAADSSGVANDAPPMAREIAPSVTDADIGAAQTWGGIDNVVSVKHLFFSEQPDTAALQVAYENGVGVVISLRDPSETEWDEAAAVENLGMTYYNVPVPSEGAGFDPEAMRTISRLVGQHSDEKLLLHCSSGNRAAAWLAVHLANDHGMTTEQSVVLARQAGLTKPQMETRVRNFLDNSASDKT